jgi:HD-like signal output (HDOD) protein
MPEDIQAAVLRYYPPGEPAISPSRESHIRGLHEPLRLGQIADLLRRIETLPALPETVAQVRDAMNDPKSSVPAVVDIITLDPPIAAKVLSVANSAAYGFSHRIHELNLAVSLLGLRETYAIVLSAAVVDLLNKFRHFDYRSFFLEAISCATASRIVGRAAGRRNLPGIFSAGLLHDIGRAALWEVVPELARKIPTTLRGVELIRAEESKIGISHAEAGYLLATHWNLPDEITYPIRFHHAPHRADASREHVAIVALADAMVNVSGTRFEDNPQVFTGLEPALHILGIDNETAEAMLDEFLTRYESALNDAFG